MFGPPYGLEDETFSAKIFIGMDCPSNYLGFLRKKFHCSRRRSIVAAGKLGNNENFDIQSPHTVE
jgi:hypothetical protein